MPAAIKLCLCGRPSSTTENETAAQIERVHSNDNGGGDTEAGHVEGTSDDGNDGFSLPAFSTRTTKASMIVGHENRPMDLLSFFANDNYLIDDTKFGAAHHSGANGSSGGTIESKPTSSTENNHNQNNLGSTEDQSGEIDMEVQINELLQSGVESGKREDTRSEMVEMSNLSDDVDIVLRDMSKLGDQNDEE